MHSMESGTRKPLREAGDFTWKDLEDKIKRVARNHVAAGAVHQTTFNVVLQNTRESFLDVWQNKGEDHAYHCLARFLERLEHNKDALTCFGKKAEEALKDLQHELAKVYPEQPTVRLCNQLLEESFAEEGETAAATPERQEGENK